MASSAEAALPLRAAAALPSGAAGRCPVAATATELLVPRKKYAPPRTALATNSPPARPRYTAPLSGRRVPPAPDASDGWRRDVLESLREDNGTPVITITQMLWQCQVDL